MDRHAGQVVRRLPGRGVVARDHTAERKPLDAPDRARVHATPAAVSHQTDAHALSRRPTSGQYVTVSPKGERRRGGPQPSQREKVVRRGRGRAWRRPGDRRPRVRRLRRSLGLRQEHAAAHDRRAGGHHLRRDRHRRPRRQRARSQGPGHRHGVPGLRALPAHDGVREHGVLAALPRHRPPGDPPPRRRGGAHPRHRALHRSHAAPALGRPAPARRHGPRHRARSQGVPVRRAAFQPRCQAARADAHRDQAPARARGHDHDLRHARPGRGDDAGRPHRHPEPWPHRADRHARGRLRPAGLDLRRGLHRRAADEFAAGRRPACRRPAVRRPAAGRAARAPGVARR